MAKNLILGLILVRLAQICPFPPPSPPKKKYIYMYQSMLRFSVIRGKKRVSGYGYSK